MKISVRSFVMGLAVGAALVLLISAVTRAPGDAAVRTPSAPERVFTPDELFIDGYIFAVKSFGDEWVWAESMKGKLVKASVVVEDAAANVDLKEDVQDRDRIFGSVVWTKTLVRRAADGHEVQHQLCFSVEAPGARSLNQGDVIEIQGRIAHVLVHGEGVNITLRDPRWTTP